MWCNILTRPNAPPMVRMKFRSPVQTALSSLLELARRPTSADDDIRLPVLSSYMYFPKHLLGCSVIPIPRPSTTRMPMTTPKCVVWPNVHFRPMPTVHSPKPTTTQGMYRPTLDMNWPELMEQAEVEIIRGNIRAPDSRALYPRTDWKYIGTATVSGVPSTARVLESHCRRSSHRSRFHP